MAKRKPPDYNTAVWPGRTIRSESKNVIHLDRFVWAVGIGKGKSGWRIIKDTLGATLTTADSEHGMREAGEMAGGEPGMMTLACILVNDVDPTWASSGMKGRGITASVVRVVSYCRERNCFLPTLAYSPGWLLTAVEDAMTMRITGGSHYDREAIGSRERTDQVLEVPAGGLVRGPTVDRPAPGLCPPEAGVGDQAPEEGRDTPDTLRSHQDTHLPDDAS